MEDFLVIQGQPFLGLLAAFLSLIILYAWRSWKKQPCVNVVSRFSPVYLLSKRDILNRRSSSQMEQQVARTQKLQARDWLSFAGDWLAPIIVWFVVITISLAIAGVLLGEE